MVKTLLKYEKCNKDVIKYKYKTSDDTDRQTDRQTVALRTSNWNSQLELLYNRNKTILEQNEMERNPMYQLIFDLHIT